MIHFTCVAILVSLTWAPQAEAHNNYSLSCTNSSNYTYFMYDSGMANKCKYNLDGDCNWKNTVNSCKWAGKVKGEAADVKEEKVADEKKEEDKKEELKLEEAKKGDKEEIFPQIEIPKSWTQVDEAPTTVEAPAPVPQSTLEDAKKEAKLASTKVEQMKITMEVLKTNNKNNALLYRAPDADLLSLSKKFKNIETSISGEIFESESKIGDSDSLGRGFSMGTGKADRIVNGKNSAYESGITDKNGTMGRGPGRNGTSGKISGRNPASSTEADTAENSLDSESTGGRKSADSGNTATSDNPWVTYMGQTTKAALIDRLRRNPSLLDSLRERIAELQSKGDQSGVVEFMEDALAEAEKEGPAPLLDNLLPMSINEAFSMDSAETEAQIRSLLADLDSPSDQQFLPQATLFQRVSVAHRRSLLRGSLKRQ